MADVPIIHVHTSSDKSTVGYVIFMWQVMRELASHPAALKLSVHCLGPTAVERVKHLPNTKTYMAPSIAECSGGSMAHASCVEQALAMTDDGDIHVIADSDTVVVSKGWDDYIRIKLLDKDRVGIIGTAVEDVGGFSSGTTNVQMAKNLPTVAWCALSPFHTWRRLEVRPIKSSNIKITNETLSKTYNLPIGFEVLRDVAWQIPQYLADRGIMYQAWKQRKGSKDAIVLKGLSDYHEEYHTEADVPFVVHHRGSMRHTYRGDAVSNSFFGAVDKYLERERAVEPRWTWQTSEENEASLKDAREELLKDPPPPPPPPVVIAAPADGGWLKAVVDGASAWGRGQLPVPKPVVINFEQTTSIRNIRLEGTVTSAEISLPPAPSKSYNVTVRNLTQGPVKITAREGNRYIDLPAERCWLLVVDVDGVLHAE